MNEKKAIGKALCPTCFKFRDEEMPSDVAKMLGEGMAIFHQCDFCRDKGREVDLIVLSQVMRGERLPLPKLDETTSLADLITELMMDTKEQMEKEQNKE